MIENVERTTEERNLGLMHIVENRMLPGLLLLDRNGVILFQSPDVHKSLDKKKHRDWIIDQFENNTSAEHAVRTVIYSNKHFYGICAFRLASGSQEGRESVIAVLVEGVSTQRLDLYRLNDSDLFHFSPREIEVIKVLQLGMTDKMIAAELKISPGTVQGYVKSIRGKLGVSTRTAILHKLFTT